MSHGGESRVSRRSLTAAHACNVYNVPTVHRKLLNKQRQKRNTVETTSSDIHVRVLCLSALRTDQTFVRETKYSNRFSKVNSYQFVPKRKKRIKTKKKKRASDEARTRDL